MGSSLGHGFVSVANIVAEVQYNIDDIETKKYYPMALQKVLNAIRNVNVHYARLYKEVMIELDEDMKFGAYPSDLVKPISVGIYKNGEFWSFTRKPNMAKTISGDGETYLDEDNLKEDEDIPRRGIMFGARGHNEGFWVEDDENCRFFVRNYTGDKVVFRYRSNGIECTTDNCVPYKVKDLIVAMVTYDFALLGKPKRKTAAELEYLRMERSRHYDEFTDLEYIPQNMTEMIDSHFASFNSTVRRML